jgi:hypothetical protein
MCLVGLGLRRVFELDGWNQSWIAAKVLCRFLELCMMIEGSSC